MLQKISCFIKKYAFLILPMLTLLCLAGFIGSYLFPNEVLDTIKANMVEEEGDTEFLLPLSQEENSIGYVMKTTGTLAMKGIQIGISKQGAELLGETLIYRVYKLEDESSVSANSLSVTGMTPVFEGRFDLGTCMDGQYPYLASDNENLCSGTLYITFSYEKGDGTDTVIPALYMNHTVLEQTGTFVGGERTEGTLKSSYIYSHDTYPFLYDCRVLTFVFLAASMTVVYPRMRKGGKRHE